MQSKWLKEQERIINEFRAKKRGQFPMVIGMIFFILMLFGVIGYINSDTIPKENIAGIIKTLGIVVAAITFALLLAKRQNNKQGCPDLRKTLEKILVTPEDINQFDSEMKMAPLHWVELDDEYSEYFFTKHYLVCKFGRVPLTEYSIFKLSDIYSTKTICTKDHSSVVGLGREYFTNLCDKERKILGSVTIRKNAQYERFIEDLQRFVPDVRLGEGK